MFQNVLNAILGLSGIAVQIKKRSDGTLVNTIAAQSNYFRRPLVAETVTTEGRQYVVSNKNLNYEPKRGDTFLISATEWYGIIEVREMRAFKNVIGYRLVLE